MRGRIDRYGDSFIGHKAQGVFFRLLASPDLSDAVKAELKRRYERYNPVLLQQEVHWAVDVLMDQNRRKALIRQQSLTTAALENF
jgi:hypothetical protein